MSKQILINLTGAPCSGKTTIAKKFCIVHPSWAHWSIDSFRIKHLDEEDAWYNLMQTIAQSEQHGIVESSGLSWRLKKLILDHPQIKKRNVITIYLHGEEGDFHKRLDKRQKEGEKEKVPFVYTSLDEHSLITYCLDNFTKKYKKFVAIQSDNMTTVQQVYDEFVRVIAERVN